MEGEGGGASLKDPERALELMSSARVQGEWSGYVHTQCRGRERTFSALFGNFPLSGCPAVVIEMFMSESSKYSQLCVVRMSVAMHVLSMELRVIIMVRTL